MNNKIIKLQPEDLDMLKKWAKDEKTLIQWCGPVFDFPLTTEQLKAYFAESEKAVPSRFIFKYVTEDGRITGMCELGNIDRRNEIGSVCRVFVDDQFRGMGIAQEILKEVIGFGFNELGLERIDLNVYTYNTPAIKCYEGLGFTREGLKRKITKYNGEYWDGYIYSLLKEEWKF
jgi:RimJ/RimL family protein N-acetyltransferase